MMNDGQIIGKRKDGVARLKLANMLSLCIIGRIIMINNTSLQKWNRLAQKQLNQQFVNQIVTGLQCSPLEANAILEAVYKVYASYFETSGTLKPGQILFPVVSVETPSNTPLSESKQVTVVLTLDACQKDLRIREKLGVTGLRLHRIQRVAHEAFQQGGLLTVEDLANRLLNCGQRTLSRDIKTLKNNQYIPWQKQSDQSVPRAEECLSIL